jgi:hypothetical protein
MDHRGRRETVPSEAHVLGSWAISNLPYVRGTTALRAGGAVFEELPATLAFDLIYCLLLEESQDTLDRRTELDAQLASFVTAIEVGDRSDRDRLAATWGKLPAHQRAMRAAQVAGGSESRADGKA